MAKKRTKKQKIRASNKPVNSHLAYSFNSLNLKQSDPKKSIKSAKYDDLGSIKKEIRKSIFVAILIVASLMVVYWFSKA
ncbi:MAG: hypothetical protein QY322_02335 [bacterium]|nr:MAG: hypothetical protein QY322_02335 [bacterium]